MHGLSPHVHALLHLLVGSQPRFRQRAPVQAAPAN